MPSFNVDRAPGYVRDYRVAALPDSGGAGGELVVAWIAVRPPSSIGLARARL